MNLPTVDAARLAIAPYMLAIKLAAGVIVLIVAAALYWRIGVWRTGYHEREAAIEAREAAEANLADEIACLEGTSCADRIARLSADGEAAVQKARQAAQEAAQQEQARVAAEGQAAVQRAEKAASVAAVRLRDAEARYRDAISRPETGCAAQAREPLRCPLR